jgi:hypothetical protein
MGDSIPRLFADHRGVWREDKPGHPFGIEWDEIVRIGGYKLGGVTELFTVVELDHPSGHFIELHADWPGFAQVIDTISTRIPAIGSNWFDEINDLAVRSSPITVWHRQNANA